MLTMFYVQIVLFNMRNAALLDTHYDSKLHDVTCYHALNHWIDNKIDLLIRIIDKDILVEKKEYDVSVLQCAILICLKQNGRYPQ